MKHPSTPLALDPDAVVGAIHAAGVVVSPAQAGLIIQHAALVLEANEHMNLTRLTEREDVLALHIVDSLAFIPHIEPLDGHIIDLGSGAGYPGVPLAILGLTVTLCESVKKKAAFLDQAAKELGLGVSVVARRAEELAVGSPGSADVVLARAVSATGALVELASPLLRTGGRLVALKGTPSLEELERAERVAPMCGMALSAQVSYVLPTGEQRMALVFEKVGRPRVSLPRRPGAAQRQPLG